MFDEPLCWHPAFQSVALMRAVEVVERNKLIQAGLQFCDRLISLFSEFNLIELLEDGSIQAFDPPAGGLVQGCLTWV